MADWLISNNRALMDPVFGKIHTERHTDCRAIASPWKVRSDRPDFRCRHDSFPLNPLAASNCTAIRVPAD